MNQEDQAARREERRASLLEHAIRALQRVQDENLRRDLTEQLEKPGGSRVRGYVSTDGNPDSFVTRIQVPAAGTWWTIATLRPADIGMTAEEVAEEIQLLRWQSGVDIPDDISGLDEQEN